MNQSQRDLCNNILPTREDHVFCTPLHLLRSWVTGLFKMFVSSGLYMFYQPVSDGGTVYESTEFQKEKSGNVIAAFGWNFS